MIPELIPVKSSQIASVGYIPKTKTLFVKFHRGWVYSYANVPQEKFDAFLAAPSLGVFLWQEIKGKHEFTKHEPPPPLPEAA